MSLHCRNLQQLSEWDLINQLTDLRSLLPVLSPRSPFLFSFSVPLLLLYHLSFTNFPFLFFPKYLSFFPPPLPPSISLLFRLPQFYSSSTCPLPANPLSSFFSPFFVLYLLLCLYASSPSFFALFSILLFYPFSMSLCQFSLFLRSLLSFALLPYSMSLCQFPFFLRSLLSVALVPFSMSLCQFSLFLRSLLSFALVPFAIFYARKFSLFLRSIFSFAHLLYSIKFSLFLRSLLSFALLPFSMSL